VFVFVLAPPRTIVVEFVVVFGIVDIAKPWETVVVMLVVVFGLVGIAKL